MLFRIPALIELAVVVATTVATAPSGPWDAFNYAPYSRTVRPAAVHSTSGSISNASALITEDGIATLFGNETWIALDFGKEARGCICPHLSSLIDLQVGGLISMTISPESESSSFALSFTESQLFINPLTSDDSTVATSNESYDGVFSVLAPLTPGLWTIPLERERGGFRYMTIITTSESPLTISNVTCFLTFSPHVADLREYTGYFYAKDPVYLDEDFLTKIWYAGAYTVQMNVLGAHQGRDITYPYPGWANNATLGVVGPVIVDGAKRDRNIWPGDMGISLSTQFVSTNDIVASKNALIQLFTQMNPVTGALPFAGPPISNGLNGRVSDTYHMWTLLGVYNYFLYSGDTEFLAALWKNYTRGVEFMEAKATSSGLVNITGLPDWSRSDRGGVDSEGNAIYYEVLEKSAELAAYMNEMSTSQGWLTNATALKAAFNDAFYDNSQGLYTDNASTTFVPQDGNALALLFNLTETVNQANNISKGLTRNWNDIGAVAPESPDTISPFISGFEIQAHFKSGNDDRAMDLLRREWGYMLYTNLSVQSTMIEGYNANGSIGYRGAIGYNFDSSYTSHAHGWSTGPTSALTFYVVGLQLTAPQGSKWTLKPHLADLSAAEGGFTTSLGWFGASWNISSTSSGEGGSTETILIKLETPVGTSGYAVLPGDGTQMVVDGNPTFVPSSRSIELDGGSHEIVVSQ